MIQPSEKPKIFISYSGADLNRLCGLFESLRERLETKYAFRYWEKDKEPGKDDWRVIFKWIESAALLLLFVLADRDSSNDHTVINAIEGSLSVGVETGYALANNVKVIPIIDSKVRDFNKLGPVKYKTRILYDADDLDRTLKEICSELEKIHKGINLYKRPVYKALTRLRKITYIFGERYYGYLDESFKRICQNLIGNDPKVDQRRLIKLRSKLEKSDIEFSKEQFDELRPFQYRNLLSIVHLFKNDFDEFLERYEGMDILKLPARDSLEGITENMKQMLKPLLQYEIPYSDGGVPEGEFKPTEDAFASIKAQHLDYGDPKNGMLKLYDSYRRNRSGPFLHFQSLHKDYLTLLNLLIEGEAVEN